MFRTIEEGVVAYRKKARELQASFSDLQRSRNRRISSDAVEIAHRTFLQGMEQALGLDSLEADKILVEEGALFAVHSPVS